RGLQLVDDDHRAIGELLRQRRANRADAHFLRQREFVAARLRPKHRAALPPKRGAARADLRAPSALLLVRLLAAAADERAILRRVSAAPLRRALPEHPRPA